MYEQTPRSFTSFSPLIVIGVGATPRLAEARTSGAMGWGDGRIGGVSGLVGVGPKPGGRLIMGYASPVSALLSFGEPSARGAKAAGVAEGSCGAFASDEATGVCADLQPPTARARTARDGSAMTRNIGVQRCILLFYSTSRAAEPTVFSASFDVSVRNLS